MKLDELQRLAEGATPGPWDAFTGGAGTVYSQVRLPTMSKPRAVCQCPSSRVDRTRSHADVAYIAAMSPDTAKKLIAVALAAQKALAALEEAQTYTASPSWSPSMTLECKDAEVGLRTALEEMRHG